MNGLEAATSTRPREQNSIEAAASKLDGIVDRLSETLRMAHEMMERFSGPSPSDIHSDKAEQQPKAPGGQLYYLHDRVNVAGQLTDQLIATVQKLNETL